MSRHRRSLAALAAALAVLSVVSAAAPQGPPRLSVVTARHQLAGGTVLSDADLEVRAVVADDLPEGASTDPAELLGRTLAAPVPRRAVLTPLAVVAPRSGSSTGGLVVAPLRLADPGLAPLLHPGDRVDVLAADTTNGRAAVVARAVRVVTVPAADDVGADAAGVLVLVEVASATATALAAAAAAGPLTLSWR